MTEVEKNSLAQAKQNIKETPLTEEQNLRVERLLNLDIEVQSLEQLLRDKKAYWNEKKEELSTNENFVYHAKWLENHINKKEALWEISRAEYEAEADNIDSLGREPDHPHYRDTNYDRNGDYVGE